MTEILNQTSEIDKTWGVAWREDEIPLDKFFKHRVFLESYPVFSSYLPAPTAGKVLLEVGTGSGRHGLKFALDNPKMRVIMTDLLQVSIDNANSRINQLGLSNAEATVADATNLPFASNTFDIVFSDAVIQYFPEYQIAVNEMARVLKPGGKLVLSVINWWNLPHLIDKKILGKKYPWGYEKSFTRKELRSIVSISGLHVVAEDGFAPAYGVYRLKYRHSIFRLIGRMLNKAVKITDPFIDGFISRNFGFQIVVIAKK